VQPVVDQPDAITWDNPPDNRGVIDITKAPLPVPTSLRSATSAESLFETANLTPVVKALNARFHNQSIVQLAVYPGELQAVIINNQGIARLVTTTPQGALKLGTPLGIKGSRTTIYPSQIVPSAVKQLARLISSHGGLPLGRISRFVLTMRGGDAYWDIYPVSGRIRFEALIDGTSPIVITAHGKHTLA
jgi:hypothetical protein